MWISKCTLALSVLAICLCGCGSGGAKKKPPKPGPASMAANEMNTLGTMRAYAGAQKLFKTQDWDKDKVLEYATPFSQLHSLKDATGEPIGLMPPDFAAAVSSKKPMFGYYFVELKTIDGKAIDWTKDYGLCAVPAEHRKTGMRTFILKTGGRVWGQVLPNGGAVTDYPANPALAGWVVAE
jgi:hypothetical protein